ncbi:MAG: hypothetical protein V1887_03820 [Candidatus Aenigmatarchaeota archaeon]
MDGFGLGAPFGMSDQFVVSFLFVLAVVFGVLELTNLFKNRAVNLLIALAISFFASSQAAFTGLLFNYLPSITWFFIAVFFIAFAMELFGVRKEKKGDRTQGAAVAGGVLLVLFSVGFMMLELFPVQLPFIGGPENLIFLAGAAIVLSLFWGAMKEDSGGKAGG